jgi:carboxylate-amine ligase
VPWDESVDEAGRTPPDLQVALDAVRAAGPAAAARRVADEIATLGTTFGPPDAPPYVVDPVPRLFGPAEWQRLERGLVQRARALDAFVADAHGPRRAVADGIVPAAVAEGCAFLEPELVGLEAPPRVRVAVAGLDVVRDADGAFRVLEDNCRTPSGLAYLLAARAAVTATLGAPPDDVRELDAVVGPALLTAVRATVPEGAPDGATVLLSDGPENTAWWEHERLAALMGVPLVTVRDLRRRGDHVEIAATGERVSAVYRRTDVPTLRDRGRPTAHGELLLPAVRAGTVGVANAYGAGVADDKALYPYVRALVRYFCGEEPLIDDVHVYDLTDAAVRDEVLERPETLVFKPRDGQGGEGVLIGPHASAPELRSAVDATRAAPDAWIAQDAVTLSTHPTVVGDELVPRHVDLRPFALADGAGGWRLLPGGLTRVAFEEGQMVVNSSRGGGAKDTWVRDER